MDMPGAVQLGPPVKSSGRRQEVQGGDWCQAVIYLPLRFPQSALTVLLRKLYPYSSFPGFYTPSNYTSTWASPNPTFVKKPSQIIPWKWVISFILDF